MAVVTLPRFPPNWQEQPHLISRYWDEAMLELEKTLNAVLAIPAIEAALQEVSSVVDEANLAIETLGEATSGTLEEQSLIASYVDSTSFSGDLITATTAGSITVANHTRVYGNSTINPSVDITGGTFSSGASPGDIVRVYYVDALKEGGSVSYLFTVDPASPVAQGEGFHSVGAVAIPTTGLSVGKWVFPPGYVDLYL